MNSPTRVSVNRPASPVLTAIIIPAAVCNALNSKMLMSSCFVLVSSNKEAAASSSRVSLCIIKTPMLCCFIPGLLKLSLHHPSSPHLPVSICLCAVRKKAFSLFSMALVTRLSAAAFHSLGIQENPFCAVGLAFQVH